MGGGRMGVGMGGGDGVERVLEMRSYVYLREMLISIFKAKI